MKALKFRSELADMILSGEKTITWRLFDDKDLKSGDAVKLIRWESGEQFGEAVLQEVREKRFADLTEEDTTGHETFANDEEMYATYAKYYQEHVGPDTRLKVIELQLKQ